MVRNKPVLSFAEGAIHIALGVRADGGKEVLGLWLEQNEGAKFWLRVMNELRNRGVEDILLAVVDGLKGGACKVPAMRSIVGKQAEGFPTRSPRCSPTRSYKRASFICCATRWTLSPGRTERAWRRR